MRITGGAFNIPVPKTHLRPMTSASPGVRPRCQDVLKLPRVIPLCSQSWDWPPKAFTESLVLAASSASHCSFYRPPVLGVVLYSTCLCSYVPHLRFGNSSHQPICCGELISLASRPTCALRANTDLAISQGMAPRVCSTQQKFTGMLNDTILNETEMCFNWSSLG